MKYEKKTNTDCCDCGASWAMLNEYGYCADCYSRLSDAKRRAIAGDLVRVVPQKIYNPPQSRLVTLAVGAAGGLLGAAALLAAAWWHLRGMVTP